MLGNIKANIDNTSVLKNIKNASWLSTSNDKGECGMENGIYSLEKTDNPLVLKKVKIDSE